MKVTLFYNVSIDGFIARSDHSSPWSIDAKSVYQKRCLSAENIIVGARSYELMLEGPSSETPPVKRIIVVSSRNLPVKDNVKLAKSPTHALFILKNENCNSALLIGGSKLSTSRFS